MSQRVLLAGLVLLFIIAGLLPISSLWGFNHLLYFSIEFKLIFILLFFFLFIPDISKKAVNLSEYSLALFKRWPHPIQSIILALFSIFLFANVNAANIA